MDRMLPARPYNRPAMDAIQIRDLRVETLIGIHKRERHVAQTVSIDLEIGLPGTAVFKSDKVADTIDYEQVALRIKALADSGHFRLVETFAERIARLLIDDLGAPWVKVSVAKIGILANAKFVGVTLERKR
jgi:dihydroneopterin aldolase